ncbi:MAG: glycosyltransferase N-terminal domain-containing protein [Chloroherpetonaceae bacterium]|nr:glycosyltransferase N-terminal domain-containing protein [Chloroherpetonaceae bacterium]
MIRSVAFIAYNLLFPLFRLIVRILALYSPKINNSLSAREHLFESLEKKLLAFRNQTNKNLPTIWFHAASVGEFEQARPIIEKLKETDEFLLVITFFSPSGYEARKNYPDAIVCYLPEDSILNAKRFIDIIKPEIAVFMRYDVWFNHLFYAKKSGAKTCLLAATLNPEGYYFKPILKHFYKALFDMFDVIGTSSESDYQAFHSYQFSDEKISLTGDPRIDQVIIRSQKNDQKKFQFESFFLKRWVFVAGSTWPKDEAFILEAVAKNLSKLEEKKFSLIIVPHEINALKINELLKKCRQKGLTPKLISQLNTIGEEGFSEGQTAANVLIIDEIGYLFELYALAKAAYVGGGFGVHIHNILEPAVYGIPVIWGKKCHKAHEAGILEKIGGGVRLSEYETALLLFEKSLLSLVANEEERISMGKNGREYVFSQFGAAERSAKIIQSFLRDFKSKKRYNPPY